MRTINANALAYINKQYASEPANIVEFDFGIYCDKEIPQASGKILEISRLDAIINVSSSSDSQEITIVLDDTDGTIKTYMESNDIHLTSAKMYQWFDGLDYNDKFTLFQGQINSPIVWDEGERTISLTILSKLEDVEIGFSPEEGQFTGLGSDYVGKPWPMCFGTVNAVETLQLNQRLKGITSDGFGMVDEGLRQIILNTRMARETSRYWSQSQTVWSPEMCAQKRLEEQQATVKAGINIFNGENFPRGVIVLDFGKCLVRGIFEGFYFRFLSKPMYNPKSGITVGFCGRDADISCGSAYEETQAGNTTSVNDTSKQDVCDLNRPGGSGSGSGSSSTMKTTECGFMYVPPGTTVRLYADEKIYYAISCVPGTIKQVTSFIHAKGDDFPQVVSTSLWHQENWDLGNGLIGVVLVIHNALSKEFNPQLEAQWSDTIFTVFESSIGPNTADVLKYIIETYSDKSINGYTSTKTYLTNYPSDFAIYNRPNIIDALQDISWQARCSITYKNEVFNLNYLPAIQTSRDTITTADILENTLSIEYTDTENIITKMVCVWEESGMQKEPNELILRNNISKYGTKSRNYDFYIYNYVDAVLKSGTFWLTKYSNTWKRVKFETPITKLALETMDYITLDIERLSNSSVVCLIESVEYNSDKHSLVFTCFVPVKAGQMGEYVYSYPSNLSSTLTYPSNDEFNVWQNSNAIGKLTSGNLSMTSITYFGNIFKRTTPDPYNNVSGETQFTLNGFSDIDRRISDRGSRFISDSGDSHPGELILRVTPTMQPPQRVSS